MPDTSPNLDLPFLLPAQAQKHVTHNEALERLDLFVQLTVQRFDAETPPAAPPEGRIWALGPAPSGDWAGQAGKLATFLGGAWAFLDPREGWRAWGLAEAQLRVWRGTGWEPLPLDDLPGLGIGTVHDGTNRLAVVSPATLFSHAGAGHQVKVNKAAAGDTASLLFQDNWSGRAEMGLAGNDDFSVKVSADGSTWTEALRIDHSSGSASVPAGFGIGGQAAFHRGNILGVVGLVAGLPSGAVIERGSNANGDYMRFADGTQICMRSGVAFTQTDANHLAFTWTYPAAFVTGSLPFRQVAFSNTDADLIGLTFQALGVTRLGAGVIAAVTRIARVQGAPAFAVGNQVTNCSLIAFGRWM